MCKAEEIYIHVVLEVVREISRKIQSRNSATIPITHPFQYYTCSYGESKNRRGAYLLFSIYHVFILLSRGIKDCEG